ncbi:lipocalin family protein [Prevotella sp. 10(H)]|uniref:lipocalin family protein n=1 Tax=Prevotella sp. 10(H) TaxID=1158294 RepID=UPI0004A7091E|nr:lipocalin family protein [Prevotella sp. 10(H)]
MKNRNLAIGGIILAGAALAIYKSLKTIPKGAVPVRPFNLKKYLGKWYEIARLDYRFEKNLNNTTAEYSLNEDKTVKVVNKGYNPKKKKEEVAVGVARFVNEPDEARLKVSFWGPIYSGYNVIAIDSKYKHALVVGKNRNYMWLLSKEKSMPEDVKLEYLRRAIELGYDVSKLVWVEHNR